MKILGIILMVAGIIWALAAFTMEPAAIATAGNLGGQHAVEAPAVTIRDIAVVDRRRGSLIFSRLTILVGALFVCFGSLAEARTDAAADRKRCPHCAELIRREASVCKHCGRDLAAPRAKPRQVATEIEPDIPATLDEGEVVSLCRRLRRNALSYEEYRQLAAAADASLVVLTGFTGADYIVTRGQEKLRFKSYEALRPWFLENIVPKVEREA